MKKIYAIGTALTGSLALGLATPAFAQGADDEIVVTARRVEERLQDVPASVSAFSAEDIEALNVQELSNVASQSAGVHWENINISKPQVFIRGFGTTLFDAGTDPSVAIFIDETYIPRFTGMSSEMLDIQRVEILKGPQGTLFGRNAAGGAISVYTQAPSNEPSVRVQAGVSSRENTDFRGTVSGPITEGVSGRLSVSSRSGDGYIDVVGSPVDGFSTDHTFWRGRVRFDLGADTNLDLSADHGRVRDGMWAMSNSGAAIPQKHPSVAVTYTPDPYSEPYSFNGYQQSETNGASARFVTATPLGDFTWLTAYRTSDLEELTDFDASAARAFNRLFAEESEAYQQELRLTGGGERLNYVAGLYYFHEEVDRVGELQLGPDNVFAINFNGGNPYSHRDTRTIVTDSWAAYGQLIWEISEGLNLSVGARYSTDEKTMENRVAQILGAPHPAADPLGTPFTLASVGDSWSSFDPSISIDYHFTPDLMIYASYRTGYKAGGFQTDPVTNAAAASIIFDPEDVRSTEAGLRSEWFSGRLRFNVSVFQNDYRDLQLLQTVPLGGGAFASLSTNATSAEGRGAEFDIVARPIDGLTLSLNYGYLESELGNYVSTATGANLRGQPNSRSPENTFGFGASYEFPMQIGVVTLETHGRYTDDFVFDASALRQFALEEGFTTVDASASLTAPSERWTLRLWARNIDDTRYRTHNIVIGGNPATAASLDTWAPPRAIGVDLTFNLN
jgi:iron complex outermembrane receptor protein